MAATSFNDVDWYASPHYYDIVFDDETELEVNFLEAIFARHATLEGRSLQRVLEPACGSGRLMLEFARRGWKTTGFDLSEDMLAYARKRFKEEKLTTRGLKKRLFAARLEDFPVSETYELAHCLVSTFKYVQTEEGARSHLERVAKSLLPGGLYVLGLHLTEYANDRPERERWVGTRDGTRVVCNIQGWPADKRARTERIRSRLAIEEQGRKHRMETNWTFRTYDARQLRRLISSVPAFEHVQTYDFGLSLEEPRALNDEQLDCLLVLRKRGRRRPA
ncbi:MAG: SAM-dependent methyltransferase [Planctomycetota bacterium]|jgi:SAM-dependent methyltransferase